MSIVNRVKIVKVFLDGIEAHRLTNHNTSVNVNGEEYLPITVFNVGAVEFNSGVVPANCEITFGLDQLPFLRTRYLQSAATHKIEFEISYFDLWGGYVTPLMTFYTESISYSANQATFRLISPIGKLNAVNLTKRITVNCSHSFGDRYCKVNRDAFAQTYTVAQVSIINPYQLAVPSVPAANQFRNNGTVIFNLTSDYVNSTLDMPYRTFGNRLGQNIIDLLVPCYLIPSDFSGIKVLPGCAKTIDDCTFFGNLNNFGGFLKVKGKSDNFTIPFKY
jgi:hypothetical protein